MQDEMQDEEEDVPDWWRNWRDEESDDPFDSWPDEDEEIPEIEEEKWNPSELEVLRFHCLGCGDCLCDAYCREYELIKAKIRRDRRSQEADLPISLSPDGKQDQQ